MYIYAEVTADTYTINDLKVMEGKILLSMNFNLNVISPLLWI